MVERLAPKWSRRGFLQRYRRIVQEPGDVWLALHILSFILRAPGLIRDNDLPRFLRALRSSGRFAWVPRGRSEQIVRLRNWWLSKPFLGRHNTCYVRAITLYRFLDVPDGDVNVHFGIEHRASAEERLHGRAWVTLRGDVLEGPPAVAEGRIREILLAPSRSR